MTQLKSVAHPEWPYAGTVHEWRGMGGPASQLKEIRAVLVPFLEAMQPDFTAREMLEAVKSEEVATKALAIYQKQNFGPDLE